MIRWITDRLGTAAYGGFGSPSGLRVVDVRMLRDGADNEESFVRARVHEVVAYLEQGDRVVICCDYGMSRSNAIAAGVLAVIDRIPLESALARVADATGEKQMKIDLIGSVRAALEGAREHPSDGRILVLGSQNFVGRALLRALNSGQLPKPFDEDLLIADALRLEAAVTETVPAAIVVAWRPHPLDTNRAVGDLIAGLRNVLDVCRVERIGIVFVSGHQVFAASRHVREYMHIEHDKTYPGGAIGDGLHLAECLVQNYADRHGLSTLIVRPTHLYGVEDERPSFLSTYVRNAICGSVVHTHCFDDGRPLVDLLHVEDFAAAVNVATSRRLTGILHIAGGEPIPTDELARDIVEMTGTNSAVETVRMSATAPRALLDASRARKALGWAPIVDRRKGLQELIAQSRARLRAPYSQTKETAGDR